METFANHCVLITGAARGIGRAIAERLLADGVSGAALLDYDYDAVQQTAKELNASGTKVLGIHCDVSDEVSATHAVKKATEAFGQIDILVNNAGIVCDSMLHKMTSEQWNSVISTNLNSVYFVTRQILPEMRRRKYGRIITIASISAFGNVGQANYSASKAGIIGFTRAIAREAGPKGITVNCVAPGMISTDIIRNVPAAIQQKYLDNIPLRRFGEPAEIAAVVSFLAGPDASYISGECISVSGAYRF